jgi:hypothetical protein
VTDIISPEEVQYLAFRVLGFLASDENRLDHFLTVTSLEPATVQSKAVSPEFLLSILDYTMKDEALLMTLQKEQHIRPASVMVGCVYLAADSSGAAHHAPELWRVPSHWPLL